MPEMIAAEDLHALVLFGAVLPIILGYLQFISQPQRQCGEGAAAAAACFDSQIPSICFTIALIALTAARSLPSSKALKICIFLLILGFDVILSSAVPNMLRWLPYFSCVLPLFSLLPFPFQLRILHFCQYIWEGIKCYVCSLFDMLPERFRLWILQYSQSVWNAMRQLVTVDTSLDAQSSLPVEANFDLEVGNGDGSIKCYVCSLFDMLPDRFWLQSVWNAMRQLVSVDTSCPDAQSSLPSEANFDLEVDNRDGSTSFAPSNP